MSIILNCSMTGFNSDFETEDRLTFENSMTIYDCMNVANMTMIDDDYVYDSGKIVVGWDRDRQHCCWMLTRRH